MDLNTVDDQLELLSKMGIAGDVLDAASRAAHFHGHICPGLAAGVAASLSFLDERKRSGDEELVAVVENDACGVDAIQTLVGCTFGKGNLIFLDHGKSVYTFIDRRSGKGLRYSQKEIGFSDDGAMELFSKVRSGNASEEEEISFRRLWVKRAADILKARDGLFDIIEAEADIPEKARIFDSFLCTGCGEKTGSHRSVEIGGGRYCIPCSEKRRR